MAKRRYKRNYYKKNKNSGAVPVMLIALVVILSYGQLDKTEFFHMVTVLVVVAALFVFLKYQMKVIRRKKYLNGSLYQVDHMSGEEFERFLKAHFENLGYKVILTPKTGDYGVDLICREKGVRKGEKNGFVVQAKRYTGKVGVNAIQQVIGGMHYYNCEKGIVITNNYFTNNAKELAAKSNVEVWDRNTISDKFKINEDK